MTGLLSRYLDPATVDRLDHLRLAARRLVEGRSTGLHRNPSKGASVEFRQHRIYVPGDEPRRLDWRVLARTDRPYVREFDQETNLRCMLIVDASGSMAYGAKGRSKFDYAVRLAAALAYVLLAGGEQAGLAIYNDSLRQWIEPRSRVGQLARIVEALHRASPGGCTEPARPLRQAAQRLGRRALVLIISDFLAPVETIGAALSHFGHSGHEVLALRVLDRDEIEFPFQSWIRFEGIEGEAPQLCEPAHVRQIYLANFRRHQDDLQRRCASLKIEMSNFASDDRLEDALPRFLQRRAGWT